MKSILYSFFQDNEEDNEEEEEEEEEEEMGEDEHEKAEKQLNKADTSVRSMLKYLKCKTGASSYLIKHNADVARDTFLGMGCAFKLVRLLSSVNSGTTLQLVVLEILSTLADGTSHHIKSILEADPLPALDSLISLSTQEGSDHAPEVKRLAGSLADVLRKAQLSLDDQAEPSDLGGILSSNEATCLEDLPLELMSLKIYMLSDVDKYGRGKGGLNVMRLVNKRFKQLVDISATRLTCKNKSVVLPIAALTRCKRIEHIVCHDYHLWSLEGCPTGLKSLDIQDGNRITSLRPLSSCQKLKKLTLHRSRVSDISPLSMSTLLEELDLSSYPTLMRLGSVRDISPLSQCNKLVKLNIEGNQGIKDLSPLCQCPDLQELIINDLPLVKDLSLFEEGFEKLWFLSICHLPVRNLTPLIKLHSIEELNCYGIPTSTSLLPLVKCHKLVKVTCSANAEDREELIKKMPDLRVFS